MNISVILDMAARNEASLAPAITVGERSLSADDLLARAHRAAVRFRQYTAVIYPGTSHLAYPVALFGAALAGVPLVPLHSRLGEEHALEILERHPGALALCQEDLDALVLSDAERARASLAVEPPWDTSAAAILYHGGITSPPEEITLGHRDLLTYLIDTVEFGAAAAAESALVSVPTYRASGVTSLLSNLYCARRVVYMPRFDPREWLEIVYREHITHAVLMPTMLAWIAAVLDGAVASTPTLERISYGGSRIPRPVLERVLQAFPDTEFVNTYGSTEPLCLIAVLGPEEHRAAVFSEDPAVRDRLGSVGRALPGTDIQIRSETGEPMEAGEVGMVFVRDGRTGAYERSSTPDGGDWFPARTLGRLDAEGYLFLETGPATHARRRRSMTCS